MQNWLALLEQSAPVGLLKASFYAYPIVNAVHVIGIGALITCVVLMDLRLLGLFEHIERVPLVRLLRTTALAAFALAAASGLLMFSVRATEYAAMPLFWFKMGLIALAGLNFIAFSAVDRNRVDGAPLAPAAKACTVLSVLLWLSALLSGRFLGFV